MKWLFASLFLFMVARVLADPLPADRRIVWNPGIPGGWQSIETNYTEFCHANVSIPGTNIVCTTNTDITAALKAAYLLVTNNSIIYLNSGTYLLTTNMWVTGNHHFELKCTNGIAMINFTITNIPNPGTPAGIFNYYQPTIGQSNRITTALSRGTNQATFVGSGVAVSNYYAITIAGYQGNPTPVQPCGFYENGADATPYFHGWTQVVQITNVTGQVATFTPPLRYDLTNSPGTNYYFWEVADYNTTPNRCGFYGIGFNWSNPAVTNYSAVRNEIYFSQVQQCWAIGCVFTNCVTEDVNLNLTSFCNVESNYFGYGWDYVGGWAYGVWEFDCANDDLIDNNIFQNMRHGYASEGFVSGSVVSYNFFTNELFRSSAETPVRAVSGNIITHGTGALFILFEGNIGDFQEYDDIHGGSLRNTTFRSYYNPVTYNSDWPAGLTNVNGTIAIVNAGNGYSNSIIGCVVGNLNGASVTYESNPQTNNGYVSLIYANGFTNANSTQANAQLPSMPTFLRAINYDTVTKQTRSDAGLSGTNSIPNSYYLTAAPSWWFSQLPFPGIGPDLATMVSINPAEARFEGITNAGGGGLSLQSPGVTNLYVTNFFCPYPYLSGTLIRDLFLDISTLSTNSTKMWHFVSTSPNLGTNQGVWTWPVNLSCVGSRSDAYQATLLSPQLIVSAEHTLNGSWPATVTFEDTNGAPWVAVITNQIDVSEDLAVLQVSNVAPSTIVLPQILPPNYTNWLANSSIAGLPCMWARKNAGGQLQYDVLGAVQINGGVEYLEAYPQGSLPWGQGGSGTGGDSSSPCFLFLNYSPVYLFCSHYSGSIGGNTSGPFISGPTNFNALVTKGLTNGMQFVNLGNYYKWH